VGSELVDRGLLRPGLRDPFALPRGVLGRLAGRLMASGNAAQQRELAELVDVPEGARVLEIGYGPGVLAAEVLERHPSAHLAGVDPSAVMRDQARRRSAAAERAGRLDLRVGAAAALPFPDHGFDLVLSSNTFRLVPDQRAAAAEIARVLRPGGTAVVSWHSARSPKLVQRRLGLRPDELDRLEEALAAHLDDVERRSLTYSVAFVAHARR
jgi:SAM-dependent methyltransferase